MDEPSRKINRRRVFTGVTLLCGGVLMMLAAAMLVLRVVSWDDLIGEREAWGVFLYFAMVLTLADGLNRTGFIVVQDDKGRDRERYQVVYGAHLKVKDGQQVEQGQILVEWDPYTFSILTEESGQIRFKDIIEGVTMKQEVDETTGQEAMVIIEHKEDLHPQILVTDEQGEPAGNYLIPSGAHIVVGEGDKIIGMAKVAEQEESGNPETASDPDSGNGEGEML